MKLETLTIRYGVKLSRNYNTVDCGMEMAVTMEPGDKKDVVFAAAVKHMRAMVVAEAEASLDEVCRAKAMDHD